MNGEKHKVMVLLMLLAALLLGSCCALADYSMPVADDDLRPAQGLDENWINVLLIGTDTRENELDSGRADTMIICSLNKQTGAVKLTSLQRDTWVQIGDSGNKNRLNAAHTFGGANLLMQTINLTYNMNITQYVTVNFYGIADIVDALGGVTVYLEEGEAGTINSSVEEKYSETDTQRITTGVGEARLNGAQALAYVRIRKLDNDFGRTNRQRKLLSAMLTEVKNGSMLQKMDFISECLKCVKTNLSLGDILTLSSVVLEHGLGDFSTNTVPGEGMYHYDSADGVSKLVIDQEECTRAIHQFIYE